MDLSFSIGIEWLWAFCVNILLITIFQRLPLLTTTGWIHAGALGTILLGCLGWSGWLAVAAYLVLGSLVTRLGWAQKQKVGIAESRGGRRGPENVWGSAATGTFLAILIKVGIVPESLFLIGFVASFAAKLADTFGSEIGKRWGRKTVLITTFRPVSAGIDGAISLEGTCASALGSLLMTLIMFYVGLIDKWSYVLVIFIVGLLATLMESFLGAIAQNRFTWLTNEVVNSLQTTFAALISILFVYILKL